MDDATKDAGHRASVSMPSLDSSDFFPALTTNSENDDFTATDSFVSTASTETVSTQSTSSAPEEIVVEGAEPQVTSEIIESDIPSSLITNNSEEQPLLDSSETDNLTQVNQEVDTSLIETEAVGLSDSHSEILPSELEDSQVDEDPSVAIDQFIKKIADEQLSSKRIEERQEEEAKEQDESKNLNDKQVNDEESVQMDTLEVSETEKSTEEPVDVSSASQESEKPIEPMEVDGSAESKDLGMEAVPEHMPESIEEIQKELDKNPPKKTKPVEATEAPFQEDQASSKVDKHKTDSDEITDILQGKDLESQDHVGAILKNALEKESLPTIEDSGDVAKDPSLIEKAQGEIKKLDVLVCGECHGAFHYVQEFADHKKGKCPKASVLSGVCESESKPQIWGFILWRSKQQKKSGNDTLSSWAMYQKWCKLPQADMKAWITAGQSIQFASKIATAKVTEVKSAARPAKQTIVQKIIQAAPAPLGVPLRVVESNKENSNMAASNIIKKGVIKPVQLNNDVTILPSTKKDEFVVEKIMAKRFNPRKKTWEYNIKWENFGHDSNTWEPISNLSHCKKLLEQFEEQLKRMKEEKAKQGQTPKGRGRPSTAKVASPKSSNFVPIAPKISNVVGGVTDDYGNDSVSRPQRSSKQKAMNQVKEWCGNISDEEKGTGSLKRKYEPDDSDEDFDDKKIKLEEDSDDSSKPLKSKGFGKKPSIQKVSPVKTPITVRNGNTTQQILPSNILIPDANGVVRINQKQLPSLSSGVYIMSKTAGIIKLDSTTSKVATSGGQTIVKVAPKIGQTQIKIVKKDGNTTKQIIHVSPKPSPLKTTSTPKVGSAYKMVPKVTKKIVQVEAAPKPEVKEKKGETPPPPPPAKCTHDSDSDDGLEPLPFPDPDEPIPDVNEDLANDDFVLDPETGKIAGVEYVDKPVVIKEEPVPQPPTTNELENIVKIAAANISDDDFQTSDSQDDSSLFLIKKEKPTPTKKPEPKLASSTSTVRKVVKYTMGGQTVRTETQILNKPITQGQQQRPILASSTPKLAAQRRPAPPQRVINQMVSQRTPVPQQRTVVRHVIEPTRPSQGGNMNVVRKTIATTPKPRYAITPQKQPVPSSRTYSALGGIRQSSPSTSKAQVYKTQGQAQGAILPGGVRRIGNTVVRPAPPQKQPVTRIVQRMVTSPKKPMTQQHSYASAQTGRTATPAKPRTVINMPSLTEDDIPSSIHPSVQVTRQPGKSAQKAQLKVAAPPKTEIKVENTAADDAKSTDEGAAVDQTDWSSFTMADNENPIYVTGDDGTIYQVAGQNEQGQTILITQGPDGQQQCLLVTSEIGEMGAEDQTQQAGTSAAPAEPAAEVPLMITQPEENELSIPTTIAAPVDDSFQTPLQIKTDPGMMEGIEDGDGGQDQVVAQVVRAEPPSPGGTHKVVVMLPDGNLMVTQVSPEEYASLELE